MIGGKKTKLLTIILLLFCLFLSSCSQEYRSTKEEDYVVFLGEVLDAELYMPKTEDLGNFTSFLSTRKTPRDPFFDTTDAIALIAQYDEEQYASEKENVLAKFQFIDTGGSDVRDVEAAVEGFCFKIVNDSEFYRGEDLAPEQLLIIGFDESNYKIAYLYHWDHAIDYIKNLDAFIRDHYLLE